MIIARHTLGSSLKLLLLLNYLPHPFSLSLHAVCVQVVKLGDSRVIETLLQAGANPNVPDPSCGLTVTHDAAREGFVDSVRVLLKYGADVNIADERGTELNDLIYFCFVFFSHLVFIDL